MFRKCHFLFLISFLTVLVFSCQKRMPVDLSGGGAGQGALVTSDSETETGAKPGCCLPRAGIAVFALILYRHLRKELKPNEALPQTAERVA